MVPIINFNGKDVQSAFQFKRDKKLIGSKCLLRVQKKETAFSFSFLQFPSASFSFLWNAIKNGLGASGFGMEMTVWRIQEKKIEEVVEHVYSIGT